MNETQTPSQDDKVVGALAHAAAILPLWGLVVPALIWSTQREKSEYIRQQSLQALAWQMLQVCLFFGGMMLYLPHLFCDDWGGFVCGRSQFAGPPIHLSTYWAARKSLFS